MAGENQLFLTHWREFQIETILYSAPTILLQKQFWETLIGPVTPDQKFIPFVEIFYGPFHH